MMVATISTWEFMQACLIKSELTISAMGLIQRILVRTEARYGQLWMMRRKSNLAIYFIGPLIPVIRLKLVENSQKWIQKKSIRRNLRRWTMQIKNCFQLGSLLVTKRRSTGTLLIWFLNKTGNCPSIKQSSAALSTTWIIDSATNLVKMMNIQSIMMQQVSMLRNWRAFKTRQTLMVGTLNGKRSSIWKTC